MTAFRDLPHTRNAWGRTGAALSSEQKYHTSLRPLFSSLTGVPISFVRRPCRAADGPRDRLRSAAAPLPQTTRCRGPAAVAIADQPALETPLGPSGASLPAHRCELRSIGWRDTECRVGDRAPRPCRSRRCSTNAVCIVRKVRGPSAPIALMPPTCGSGFLA